MTTAIEQVESGHTQARQAFPSSTDRAAAAVSGTAGATIRLPEDAREWVDPCTLSLLVQDEVQALSFRRNTPGADAEQGGLYEVLAYAYAAGVLASEEIAAACRSNPAFRFLSGGVIFFPEELTRFRRQHRRELETILTRVLACVAWTNMDELQPVMYLELLRNAQERLDIARHLDAA